MSPTEMSNAFIKEKGLTNLTRNQKAFIDGFFALNSFGFTDSSLLVEMFDFKKKNGN